jgi:hypothetical protein
MTKYFFMLSLPLVSSDRLRPPPRGPAARRGFFAKSGGRDRAKRDDYGGLMQSLDDKIDIETQNTRRVAVFVP